MVQVVQIRATEIKLQNKTVKGTEVKIETKNDYRVNYSEDGNSCRAKLQIGLSAIDDPDVLSISCICEGDFSINNIKSDDEKKNTHIECYHRLFPYAQALFTRLCTDSGLPPFYFPEMDMSAENVKIEK